MGKEKDGETILEQFSLKRLYPRSRLFADQGQRALCASVPFIVDTGLPLYCEFAKGKVSERSEGRLCTVDNGYCSPSIFKNSDVFKDCETRLEQLAKERT